MLSASVEDIARRAVNMALHPSLSRFNAAVLEGGQDFPALAFMKRTRNVRKMLFTNIFMAW